MSNYLLADSYLPVTNWLIRRQQFIPAFQATRDVLGQGLYRELDVSLRFAGVDEPMLLWCLEAVVNAVEEDLSG